MDNQITIIDGTEYRYDYTDYSALDALELADSTKIKYRKAWERALAAGVKLDDPKQVLDYALALPPSGRLHLSAMMKIQTTAAADRLKGTIEDPLDVTPQIVAQMQAALWKLEALQKSIPTKKEKGKKAHTWLTQEQVNQLTALPFQVNDSSVRARRDYIVLATLLGAGLRRQEMHELTFKALKQIPTGRKLKDVLQVRGKGDVSRVILISPLLSKRLREWKQIVGGGRVARAINKADKINDELSEDGIFDIVRQYGKLIGIPNLDPHDCRRSCGRLIYEATGHDIMFVKEFLGHKDVKTTMVYIGLDLDLDVDESEFVIYDRDNAFMPVSGD